MAYLVTGGTGMIGSRVVRDLVREGEQVVIEGTQKVDDGSEVHVVKQGV